MALMRTVFYIICCMALIGCGGGDGGLSQDGPSDPSTPDPITISLSLSDTNVSDAAPITVTATVKQGNSPLANRLVSFEVNDSELAYLSPENGASSTNSEGVATVMLMAGTKAGGGDVIATISSGEESNSVGFNSAGDGTNVANPKVSAITLFASNQQIASSGADEVELTAIVKDKDNNLLANTNVSFSASSGGVVVTQGNTGLDGRAIAKLTTAGEPQNRLISLVAQVEDITDSINIQVVGTSINLTGSSSLAINDTSTYIVNVLDSDGNGIAETNVTLSLLNESTETPAGQVANITLPVSVMTDTTGKATIDVTGTTGGTNTIVANALGAITELDVAVQADSFIFTGFNNKVNGNVNPSISPELPDVLLSKTVDVTLTWLRSGQPVADNTPVNFTTTRGNLASASGVTSNGKVTASITSTNAGKALVTFTGSDGNIVLNNQIEFEFIAEDADRIIAQASPNSIAPNGDTSTISVVVRDPNGNLVKNKVVDFNLSDTNGGSIFPASATTDRNGAASTVYTSNTVSAENEVIITATVKDTPSVSDVVNLTVADRELFISIGTGNEVEEIETDTYKKTYSVFVTDVDSTPVENAELTVSAIPRYFYKGMWVHVLDENGEFLYWGAQHSIRCDNEDVNRNGILDPGEDVNGDGMLTPGNIVAADGNITTDDTGRAVIDIVYPQSDSRWVDIQLKVSTKVTGTENLSQSTFTLPVSAEDVNSEFINPPVENTMLRSPYGLLADCTSID
ncbi:Ig-like domain-containing protein [Thalassotalea sediminis]|uniref:Ig-like domain-containing protein n=1 Tax=Thalassotalea sediminis TaxID=1759089 RepID=UPI002573A57A|nr:Ig-like domain-containing protein [Thalassotalea sediminis]